MGFGPKTGPGPRQVLQAAATGAITNVDIFGPATGNVALSATEASVDAPVALAGTISAIFAQVSAAVTSGHVLTGTLRVNGVDTALVVSIDNADGTTVVSAQGSVAVAAGDLLSIRWVKDTAGSQTLSPTTSLAFEL